MAGYNAKPVPLADDKASKKERDLVVLNEEAILKEMARMGEGIVEKVQKLRATQNEDDSEGSEGSGD